MKYILILLFITNSLYGQIISRTPYQVRMDSIGASNCHLKLDIKKHKGPLTIRPYKWVKMTITAGFNKETINKIYANLDDDSNVIDLLDNMDSYDYINLGKYDIRFKWYLTKNTRLTNRILVTGINTNSYQYSMGINIKF